MDQSEMILPNKEKEVWNTLGKGIDERPCRSTWWVVSLESSIGPEICVCDSSYSYYHTLGPEI